MNLKYSDMATIKPYSFEPRRKIKERPNSDVKNAPAPQLKPHQPIGNW